jgi:class 3 adenylate cyclase
MFEYGTWANVPAMTRLGLMHHGAPADARLGELRRRQAASRRTTGAAQRKDLTVLFADISGSTALSRSVELDRWWSMLGGLFELMCEGVYRFGGWAGNFTGDGVQAVFDAPARNGAHARRACDAALWLRDSLREAIADGEHPSGLELDVRIGINSGEAVVGTIGERYSRHYTACGYTVALAKRIETLAGPGGIYLSENTATLLGSQVELNDLGCFDVKGADSPIGVFELIGVDVETESSHRESRTRFQRRIRPAGLEAGLVGSFSSAAR